MNSIYTFGIRFYSLLILIASPFNKKASLFFNGRKKWELNNQFPSKKRTRIWIHAASLGEFEQGKPIIEAYYQKGYEIIITFFSPSGYEICKNYDKATAIYYLPIDTKSNARKFLKLIQPDIAIFIKYEFWYNYLQELKKAKIPTVFVSSIFRPDQIFFKFYGKWFKNQLLKIDVFFVQNETSKKLLESIGIKKAYETGDTRFESVIKNFEQNIEFDALKNWLEGPVIIVGSSWKPDIEILTKSFEDLDSVKWIIAPHEINENNINFIKESFKKPSCLWTEKERLTHQNLLIIDQIGILKFLYKFGDICIIGGGFGKGIHNTLEAAVFGKPVLFGPNYQKFQEAKDLIKLGGAISFNNENELKVQISELLNNKNDQLQKGSINRKYVMSKTNSTTLITTKIQELFQL